MSYRLHVEAVHAKMLRKIASKVNWLKLLSTLYDMVLLFIVNADAGGRLHSTAQQG